MDTSRLLALRPGKIAGWKYTRAVRRLGRLELPSGRLEACDPFVHLGEGLVFAVPAGSHPVYATIADVSYTANGGDLRPSYLSLVIAEGEPARVEFMTPEGEEPPADPNEVFGVPVDTGTVAFADAEAVARCMPPDQDSWLDEVFESDSDDSWSAQMDAPKPWGEGLANIVMPNATAGQNVVLCAAGWGDGVYPVLGSYDSAGNLLAVHIDLLVEEEEDAAEDAATGPAKLSFWRRWFFPPRQD